MGPVLNESRRRASTGLEGAVRTRRVEAKSVLESGRNEGRGARRRAALCSEARVEEAKEGKCSAAGQAGAFRFRNGPGTATATGPKAFDGLLSWSSWPRSW